MARKRNYKAEYAKRKAKAKAAGYKSPYQYGKARKALGVPRNASPIPRRLVPSNVESQIIPMSAQMRRIRAECQKWSDAHSQKKSTRYSPSFTDKQARQYHRSFVQYPDGLSRRKAAREKKHRIWEWFHEYQDDDREWNEAWKSELTPV